MILAGFGRQDRSRRPKSKRSGGNQSQVDNLLRQAMQAQAQGNGKQAELCYRKAIAKDSGNHRLYLRLASFYLERSDGRSAKSCYEQAVKLAPSCLEAHESLARLHLQHNDPSSALLSLRQSLLIEPSEAITHRQVFKIFGCCDHRLIAFYDDLAAQKPASGELHYYLSGYQREAGDLQSALAHALNAVRLQSGDVRYRILLGSIYKDLGLLDQALHQVEAARCLSPVNERVYHLATSIYLLLGEFDKSLEAARAAVEIEPVSSKSLYLLGRVFVSLGQVKESISSFKQSIALNPGQVESYFELSLNLESVDEASHLMTMMKSCTSSSLTDRELSLFHAAQSNCHHRLGDYRLSAQSLVDCNRHRLCYEPSNLDFYLQLFHQYRDVPSRLDGAIFRNASAKIFIVGMPRCGSTLIESILSVNPLLVRLGETASLLKVIEMLSTADSADLGQPVDVDSIYLGEKQVKADSIVLDKNLYNFAFLPWLPCVMPDSRVIHVRRHPLDCLLSVYRAHFTSGAGYSSSLLDSARLLIEQEAQMRAWKSIDGLSIYTIHYDQLVVAPEAQIRGLIDWLGWDWSSDYLQPEKKSMASSTASVVQIRRPINGRSRGVWTHYVELLEAPRRLLIDSGLFDDFSLEV